MATDNWLMTIGSVTQTVFWAIGYFFGFTLVTVLSIGTLLPGAFDEIGHAQPGYGGIVYRREGKFYLAAVVVAAVGWIFLGGVSYWWIWAGW